MKRSSGRINLHNALDSCKTETGQLVDNFLMQFRDPDSRKLNKFTAAQFLEVWDHFDSDGNGYIEATELDHFLTQFVTSVLQSPHGSEVLSETAFRAMKTHFMEAYDENEDGRIEIGEMSQILPTDEEFLVLFQRDHPVPSSVEFMKVWKQFDRDKSGFIEANELEDFIGHLLKKALKRGDVADHERIIHYKTIMLKLFDRNGDGKLQLSEMARLLPIKENYLAKPLFGSSEKISYLDLDRIFKTYDEDRNGFIDGNETKALLVDLLELCEEPYDEETLEKFLKIILDEWDVNRDGKINKKELKMILNQHSKLGQVSCAPYNRITLQKTVKDLI